MPAAPTSTVCYTATTTTGYRALMTAVGAIPVLILGGGLATALFAGTHPVWPAVVILAPLFALAVVVVARGPHQRFRVTSAGVELRDTLRTRRIPWADVAVVEVERNLVGRGATVIITRAGHRYRSAITEARSAQRRGEATADHGHDLLQPARPTRAAIAAHQAYRARAA